MTPQSSGAIGEADLLHRHSMLLWATTVRLPGGGRLFEHNPLTGVKRIREINPKRPVATWERFDRNAASVERAAI